MPSDDERRDALTVRHVPRWRQATAPPSPRKPSPEPARSDEGADTTDDRFEIGEELGRGGMGCVVAATDTLLERPVAIKHALLDDKTAQARFEREAKITAQLEHPAIIPIHDAGVDEQGRSYYVMRRIEGEPLVDRIGHAPDVKARLAMVSNVVAAVDAAAFAHARGVIHRDIKPSNILVGAYGETLLIDWGLARRIDDVDADAEDGGRAIGTPGYMAPEQARGAALDTRTDVYALGATLLHVLTGTALIDGSPTEWLAQVAAGAPPPLGKVPPEVPDELVAIVGKAMAVNPAQRYRDAGELASDLRAFLAGQLVAAHRYTTFERIVRFARRHRVAVATAAAAVLTIIVVGVIAIQRVVRERDRATAGQRLAAERAEVLLLDRASTLASRSPTRAVAMLRGVPRGSRHLARARDIAATAAAHGIARGRAAHEGAVWALAIAPDGRHLVSGGQDGTVQIHDLETGVGRTIVRGTQRIAHAVWTHGGKRVAYSHDRGLFVVDVDGGTPQPIDVGANVTHLVARDDRVVRYLESNQTLVERAAEPQSKPVVVANDVKLFAIRGDRMVVDSGETLRILDSTGERVLWQHPYGHVGTIDISPDASRAVTASIHAIIEWDLTTAAEARRWAIPSVKAFYAGARLYAVTDRSALIRVDPGPANIALDDWSSALIAPTSSGVTLLDQAGAVWMIDEHGERKVIHGERGPRALAAGGPYVAIASSTGDLRWWDARTLLPRSWSVDRSTQLCAIDEGRVYLFDPPDSVTLIPRGEGTSRTIATTSPLCGGVTGLPDAILSAGSGQFETLDVTRSEARRFTGVMPHAHGDAIVFVQREREVHELVAGASRLRWSSALPITHLAVGATKIAFVLSNNHLVRLDRATGIPSTIAISAPIRQVAVADDGSVWLVIGAEIHRWADSGMAVVATFPERGPRANHHRAAVAVIGILPDGTAVAVTRELSVATAWTVTPGGVVRRATEPSRALAFGGTRTIVSVDVPTAITLTYLDSGERISRNIRTAMTAASDDRGLAVLRQRSKQTVVLEVYRDPVPADPTALHAWIDATTNAVIDSDRDELVWRLISSPR